MIPLPEAQAVILAAVPALPVDTVAPRDALGLVLAEDVTARSPVPPFTNTAMDGYAVRAGDTRGATDDSPVQLHVVGELAAGSAPTTPVQSGEAVRIMTGAPMPDGADAVVMVERTRRAGDDAVSVSAAAEPGQHVRRVGGDLEAGQLVFAGGTVLGPAHLGVLASIDQRDVVARRRARVGVLSTGDELVASGPLRPGQIRDSNRPMLLALAERTGATPTDFGIVGDDEATIVETLERACDECDVVLTSGGVSVGDYDYVKAALDRLAPAGAFHWWQVAIKPAKPLAFGMVGDAAVFGLPGNPVSSLVSFECFARPAILQMMGYTGAARFRATVTATAGRALSRRADGKLHLDRVLVHIDDGRLVAVRSGEQASNVLSATALANGLALVPDGEGIAEGDAVEVMLLELPS